MDEMPLSTKWADAGVHYGVREDRFRTHVSFRIRRDAFQVPIGVAREIMVTETLSPFQQ